MGEPVITPADRAYGEAFDQVCRDRNRLAVLAKADEAFFRKMRFVERRDYGPEYDAACAIYSAESAAHEAIVREADAAGKAAKAALKGIPE